MIKDNIQKIRGRISFVCRKVNKDPQEITLVVAVKGRSIEQIIEAIVSGIVHIGENRVQEAVTKHNQLRTSGYSFQVKWHMLGHLQTNKVKDAVRIFDLIHSVDSLRLAEEIDRQAVKVNKIQDILIEVKTSPEETKFGIRPEDLLSLIEKISQLKNIRLKGLMTVAPLADNPSQVRVYFKMLKELSGKIYSKLMTQNSELILSMGMTDDFEIAIEEGSNMIRIGRGIFEDKDL